LLPTADLLVVSRRPGRFPGESRVVLVSTSGATARGLWFAVAGERPWADLDHADLAALAPIARALGPGASIMVAYGGDETEHALRRRVPAAATPLGLALVEAGCRWLKDWYFAEGGREGHTKLQGELPLDDAHRRDSGTALRAELQAFLAGGRGAPDDRARARRALTRLDAPGPVARGAREAS
jgi:hypothetical protein